MNTKGDPFNGVGTKTRTWASTTVNISMTHQMEIMDRSIPLRLGDALLFLVPTCVLFYLVAFQFKHEVGKLPAMVFHWCLIVFASALMATVLYHLLHVVRYQVTAGSLVRTERKILLFKSVERIPSRAIADIALETGKNSFTGTPRYLLVLRFKDKRFETITTSQRQARIRELQAAMVELLKPGEQ